MTDFAPAVIVVEHEGDTLVVDLEQPVQVVDVSLGTAVEVVELTTGAPGPAGPPGEDGTDGAPGATGPPGPAGADGATGPAGPASTVPGPPGPPGEDGTDGAPGATGPAGAQGVPGVAGAQGPAGATGSQGPQGIQGVKGDKGDPGTAGATGATGSTGAAGPGVAAGGTTDQLLAKASATDYATKWVDAPTGGGGANVPGVWAQLVPRVGQYLTMATQNTSSPGSISTTTANSRYAQFIPTIVPLTMTFDMVSQNVVTPATDAGAVFRVGLYAADSATGGPGDLVREFGAMDATGVAGVRSITISPPLTVPPGLYWMFLQFQTATTAGTNPSLSRNAHLLSWESQISAATVGQFYQGNATQQSPLPADIRAFAVTNVINNPTVPRCNLRRSA